MDQSGQQERQGSPSGPSHWRWSEYELSIFLVDWEVVELEVGQKGKRTCKKVRSIRQRLYCRGLRKTWHDCLQLMTDLKTLHWRLSHERAGVEPLFSPYSENLYRILGHRQEWSPFPGLRQTPDEVSHPGKMLKKVRSIGKRLYQGVLRKTWLYCLQLMLNLKTLHLCLSNDRAGIKALISPYSEDFYRILGHRKEWSPFPGPLYDGGVHNPMLHMYSQPPMLWPTPMYQPWDYGFPVPSGALQGNPPPMMYRGDS
ncbi:uncharacterized protein LOC128106488 [Peromyscus californicus insignis]|uniref:uncharacterized protein LOC128106488 n=1 Tax=Peromyscus californicus insignis TaxID=564181 RepID=UPI0022A6F756|nr:uncharacterized protein LOC128106488 [Peromyscus californicus insignis]